MGGSLFFETLKRGFADADKLMQIRISHDRAQNAERGQRCRNPVDYTFIDTALEVSADCVEDRPQMLSNYLVCSGQFERGYMQQTMQFGLLGQAVQEKAHDPGHHKGRFLVLGQTHLQLASQPYPAQARFYGRAQQIQLVEKISEQSDFIHAGELRNLAGRGRLESTTREKVFRGLNDAHFSDALSGGSWFRHVVVVVGQTVNQYG